MLLGIAGVSVVLLTAADQLDRPGESRPVRSSNERVLPPPNPVEMIVWRNGTYHTIRLHPRRSEVRTPDGNKAEKLTMDPAEAEAQLPPVDPALSDLNPTPDQVTAARAASGVDKLPPPPRQ